MLVQNQDLTNFVAGYKTTAAKKAALTRDLKSLRERCVDVQEAYDNRRYKPYGWLLGDRIFLVDVKNAQRNMEIVEQFKSKL